MDRININNLFNQTDESRKPLDVYSLYHPYENKTINKINFDIDKLGRIKKEKRLKLLKEYERVYNMCLNRIMFINEMNRQDFIYEIPEAIFGFYDYNKVECIEYIDKRIKKLCFDTIIVNDHSLYISWINIEENRKRKDD